jgi:hypothetical protein
MSEPVISCPSCKTEIKLTESLAAPLIQAKRQELEAIVAKRERDIAKKAEAMEAERAKLEAMKAGLDEQVAAKLVEEREKIVAEEAKRAKTRAQADMVQKDKALAELQGVLAERDQKLAEAQAAQVEHLRLARELEDQKRELDLTVEKKVQESLTAVREKAKTEAEEALKLRVTEKEAQIASMQRQIEELKRKADQGSQQLQGEALELDLEAQLRSKFPLDLIEPVPKGEHGGDVLQKVLSPTGQVCGAILWETKRTKNWSDGWLPKLRDDKRAAKADVALLLTQALPKGVSSFDRIEGVWVAEARYALPVAIALRQGIVDVFLARQSSEGQQTKMELVYGYLTGPRFRHRVEAMVEKIAELQEDLDKERKLMMRLWSKREAQIQGLGDSTAGMYGDLQGIAGKAIDEIEGLTFPLLETSFELEAAE